MNGKFEIYIGIDGLYWFRLRSPSDEILGRSEGYTAKHNAVSGISSVKVNSRDRKNFNVFEGKGDNFYFHLEAQNGEIILQSSGYKTEEAANSVVAQVMRYAPNAPVSDLILA